MVLKTHYKNYNIFVTIKEIIFCLSLRVKRYDEILDEPIKGGHEMIFWMDGDTMINILLIKNLLEKRDSGTC